MHQTGSHGLEKCSGAVICAAYPLALLQEVVRYKGASSSLPAQFRHLPPCEEEAAHIRRLQRKACRWSRRIWRSAQLLGHSS